MTTDKKHLQPLILQELARHGMKSRAAKTAGVSRSTIELWINTDKKFKSLVAAAIIKGKL